MQNQTMSSPPPDQLDLLNLPVPVGRGTRFRMGVLPKHKMDRHIEALTSEDIAWGLAALTVNENLRGTEKYLLPPAKGRKNVGTVFSIPSLLSALYWHLADVDAGQMEYR